MKIVIALLIFIFAFVFADWADAAQVRSKAARLAFVKATACPATGLHKLPCKGWIIDHRVALCVGGADKPTNMQWMTVADAKAKDRWECKR